MKALLIAILIAVSAPAFACVGSPAQCTAECARNGYKC